MVVDGKPGEPFSAVRRPLFSPDGAHLAYEAMAGELWHLVVDGRPNAGTATRYLGHEFSGDSSRIAYIDDADERGEGRLVVADLAFATHTVVAEGVSGAVSNDERSRVAAVSRVDGRQRVIAFRFDDPDMAKWWPLYDAVHGVTFGLDGVSVAYVAERSGEHLVVLDEKEAPLPPGEALVGPPVVRPDRRAVAALVASGGSVVLRHFFDGAQGEARYEEAEGLVYDDGGRSHAFAARRGSSWFVVVNGREGPPFDRVVTPVFSPDGKAVVYRARKDGMRFVVVADTKGKTRGHHRSYEQVFPVLFTADGKSAAYGIKDGKQLAWKVEAL